MTKAMDDASFGIEWGQKRLADLDFADDISDISHSLAGIQEITNNIETFGADIGLKDKLREDQGYEDRARAASSHPHHATERGLRREVSISWKLHVKRRRFRAGCMRKDWKNCIHFPTASSYMVINYHQLRCKVTSVHSHYDPNGNLWV